MNVEMIYEVYHILNCGCVIYGIMENTIVIFLLKSTENVSISGCQYLSQVIPKWKGALILEKTELKRRLKIAFARKSNSYKL